ncbi:hypothetical protein YC2023_058913 [Brassica napus]
MNMLTKSHTHIAFEQIEGFRVRSIQPEANFDLGFRVNPHRTTTYTCSLHGEKYRGDVRYFVGNNHFCLQSENRIDCMQDSGIYVNGYTTMNREITETIDEENMMNQ